MVFKNGGFPPIIYCDVNNKDPQKKDRLFPSKIQQNHTVNIRNLLKEKIQQPLIQSETPNDDMVEIAEL
jgi:hypothetical protein